MVRLTKHPRNKFGVEKFSPSKKHPTKSQCTKKTPRSKNSTCFFQQSWPEFFFPGIFPKQNKDTKRVFLRILGPIFLGKRNSRKPYGRITRRSEAGWLLCGDAVVKVRKGGPKKSHGPMAFFFFFLQNGWGVKWTIVTMKQKNWRVVSSFKQDIFRIFEGESWFASCIFTRKLKKILYFTFNVLHRVKPYHSVGLIFLWVFLGDKATNLGHIVKGSIY